MISVIDQASNAFADNFTAICAGVVVILGGVGTLLVRRAEARTREAAINIGTKNGRGDLFKMMTDLQDSVGEVSDRVGTMDRRLLNHEESVSRRLDGMHMTIKGVDGRVKNLERKAP